jgi:PAS domain S-box-containing protein
MTIHMTSPASDGSEQRRPAGAGGPAELGAPAGTRLEEKVRRLEQRLTDLESRAHFGSWEWDMVTDRISWSDELCRVFGLPVGQSPRTFAAFLDVVHPDDQARVRAVIELAARDHQPFRLEHRLAAADGVERLIWGSGHVEVDDTGTPTMMLGIARDVTERRRAQAARARLLRLINDLPGGIQAVDATGRFVVSNGAANQLLGRDLTGGMMPVDGTGMVELAWLRRLDGTSYSRREIPLYRALYEGEVVHGEQMVVTHPATGEDTVIFVDGAPLRNPDGTISGAVVLFQDITRLKEAERSREEFLAMLSHDLRSPITSIKGMAQILRRRAGRMAEADGAQMIEGLERIDASAEKMSSMIGDLLDLARLEMGRPLDLEREPLDLVALARAALDDLRRTDERHTYVLATAEEELAGEWDGPRLERVLDNLIGNAAKYTPEGGSITVSVARDESDGRPMAVVTVADTGIGIPADDLPRIFERFHRARNAAGRAPGTGLGLAGAHQIVEQHGGAISVASTEGAGTTVTVRLPLD